MMDQSDDLSPAIVIAMSDIVAAHLSNTNTSLPTEHVPAFIRDVYAAIREIMPDSEKSRCILSKQPAIPVERSVFPDYLVCLEDGKKLKMLKRHLQTKYGMTPAQYREKWQLPKDYPMVAPEYAKTRANLARDVGLGRKIVAPTAATIEGATAASSRGNATAEAPIETAEAAAPAKKTTRRRSKSSATKSTLPAVSSRKTSAPKASAKPRTTRKASSKAKEEKA